MPCMSGKRIHLLDLVKVPTAETTADYINVLNHENIKFGSVTDAFRTNQGMSLTMNEAGHSKQGLILSPLLQTHELRAACTSCYQQTYDVTTSAINVSHLCPQNILLARQRGGSDTDWRHVSPRPKFRNPAKYVKCLFTVEGGACLQYGNRCTFAKSEEEAIVWNFLKSRGLEHSSLIRLVAKAQGREEEKEELSVAERIQSLFTGHFLHLCHTCFHNRPQLITPERPAKVCGHPLRPALVLFEVGRGQGGNVTVNEIRPIPLGLTFQQFRHCWHVQRGDQCRTTCTFPHNEAEMVVWTAEKDEGLNRNDLLTVLEEPEAQESPGEPKPWFYCALCQLQFSTQDGFVSHCSSLAHERRYCDDEHPVTEWKYRCPPDCSQAFELCKRSDSCEYGENCTSAHSIEELQEWCLRTRMVRRKRKAALEQGLLSYRDQLLMEYRESLNEVLIMSEDIDGVTVTCDKDLHFSSKKEKLKEKWAFTINSERPLKAAALLKQEPGAIFTLGDNTNKDPCAYLDGSLSCTQGTSYTLTVSFSSDCPGRYEQWLVLDFDMRPVLLRKIQVDVGGTQSSLGPKEDMSPSSSPSSPIAPPLPTPLRTEPWHRGNRVIVPCLRRTKKEEELLKEYKPPRLNQTFKPAAKCDVALTRKNYREIMHSFLYREELAQEEVLSRLSLQNAIVTLSDSITRSSSEMMVVPYQKLYASVPLSYTLTPHTPEGQLLRTAVGSALVAPSPSAKKEVYEAQVLLDASTEDTIYLLLSRDYCSALGLQKDTSCPMDIQFQLNRLQFCEWHEAVDLLPDVERVLPDLTQGSVPDDSEEYPNLKLNAEQMAAMSLIIRKAGEQTSTAPVLIYGPFGTGKTLTLATAIKQLLRQPGTRVLLCTHTNSSADLYVKDHFHQYVESGHPEARPLRIKANKKGLAIFKTDDITLRYCLVSPDYEFFLFPKRSDLDSHRVVITTASMARHLHDLKLPADYFSHILIDEASQMLECAALIPLMLAGSRTKVVLTGDHMQTGPKLFSTAEGHSSSDHTLLTRLFHYYQEQEGGTASRNRVIFSENYRCTKEIVDFIATHFYFGKLDVRSHDAIKASATVLPHPRFHPLRFHYVRGTCSWNKESKSWYNAEEAKSVVEIVEELHKEWPTQWGKREQQAICVLSEGYQIKIIRRELRKRKLGNVIVETVHNVQGRQFRAILMTAVCTRDSLLSSHSACPELFGDARVLNTAMTRAQSQVVAVGDAPALCYFGKCSKIWNSYIKECIDKGSASPQHITITHIEREVKEISKLHKIGEGYNSDGESSESEASRIEDPILQELLDGDVQVTITKEGLLEIIQKTISGDTTICEDWSDTDIAVLLRTKPNDFKRCKLIMEKFDSGYAIPLDQPTRRINITGKENIGRSFPGDVAAVEILRDEESSCNGKVVGVLKSESRSMFVCAIDNYDSQVMRPINKCASKIFAPFVKDKPNYVALRRKENGHWIPHEYIKIDEDSRQNCLFVVEVLEWVKPHRFPLGVVTEVLQKTGSEDDGLLMLDIEYQLLKGPPKYNERDFKVCFKNRKNFCDIKYQTFTIDSVTSQDLDDAISVKDLGDQYEIGVHITDVASFVTKGSEVDKYAETQGNVLYRLNEEPAFLFPEALRQNCLSLLPNCKRRAISLIIVIEKESNRILARNFFLSEIKSKRQMTYKDADEIIRRHYVNSGVPLRFDTLEDCLAVAYHFSRVHKHHRVSGNWRHVQSDEGIYQDNGMSHDMVEELMIMYNSFVADFLIANEETENLTPLRCQDCPDPQKVCQFLTRHSNLMSFSAHLSYLQENMDLDNDNAEGQSADEQILKGEEHKVDREATVITKHCPESFTEFSIFTSLFKQLEVAAQNRDFYTLVKLITADDIYPQLQPVAMEFSSLLQKSYIHRSNSTSQSKVGHHDLLLDSYTWASSPMRRYMDVILQRLLHCALEETRPRIRYSCKEIDLFCALYMEKCRQKAAFDTDVQNVKTTICLSHQSAEVMAVVNDFHPRGHNFHVSFPLNPVTLSQTLSIRYKDLQLIDQPEYNEESNSMILKWKRRVYSFTKPLITSDRKEIQLNPHITAVQPDIWKCIVSAIRAEDWEKVLHLFQELKPSLNRCLKEGKCRLPDYQHYTELSLELKVGQSLPVQLGTDTSRGRTFPAVQLMSIHPQFDICLQHSKDPIMCFSPSDFQALKKSKQEYSSYMEYIDIWRPMCAVDTAYSAVAENDSIVIEGVKITWTDDGKQNHEGFLHLSQEQKKKWSIEFDIKNCFLCIRLRGQMGNGWEGMDFSGISPLLDLEDPQTFTWVAHGATTKRGKDKASKSTQIDFRLTHLSMKNTPDTVYSRNTVFTVELIPKKLPYVLREHAIAKLAHANELVKNITMGKIPFHKSAALKNNAQNLERTDGQFVSLNESQNDAIKKALEMPFTLIQGPPGTGKTVVGIHIVYWFFMGNQEAEATGRHTHRKKGLNKKNGILYCGPSNKSVDIVAEQLLKLKEVKPLRVYSDQIEMLEFPYPGSHMKVCRKSLREEKPNEALRSITLRYLIRKEDNPFSHHIKSFEDRIEEDDIIDDDEIARYRELLNKARQHEIKKHDVILCTCTAAQDPNFLKTMNFRQILVDECSMATEPEALIPLVAHKPEQIVLLGDHKQIQPIVHCDLFKKMGMNESLFERFQTKSNEHLVTMLDIQYRMHEDICKFPSEKFYNGCLKTGAIHGTSVLLSSSKKPSAILFGHVDGQEEMLVVSTAQGNENSTMNVKEAEQAVRIASLLISKSGIEARSIAILTPYNAQRAKINEVLSEKGIKDVPVCTIMKSQGSEWRYVILSTVRSCPRSEIDSQVPRPTKSWLSKRLGFITDPNHVNVAITRAQEGLCILGNQHLLKCNGLWEELLEHYQKQGCVVDPAKAIQVNPIGKSTSKRRK